MQTLIDSHCHLDIAAFDADRAAVIRRAQAAGVQAFVVPGIHRRGWPGLVGCCRQHPGCHLALGLHPVFQAEHTAADVPALASWIAAERPVAVGEIGLDFALPQADRRAQQAVFEAQLEIAAAHRLPVILHVRKAHDTVLQALRRHDLPGGICHAFNGSAQQAAHYETLGFRLGFGGMLTFERSRKLRALAAGLPLDLLVLETDAPDLTVASHQYQRNSPEYLPEILAALAALRPEPIEEIAARTTANTRAVLALPAAG